MRQPLRLSSLLAFTCCLFLSAGCGGKKTVTVTGNLVLPDNLKLEKDDSVAISIVPEGGGVAQTASFNSSNNTFEAKGVAVGKNKITVAITPYPGTKNYQQFRDWIKQNINEVFDTKRTPLSCDVQPTPAEQSFTIDLPKKTVTPK